MNNIGFISKKGLKPLLFLIGLALVLTFFISDFLGNVAIVLVLVTVYIFRDTKRYIFENSTSVLAPVDGKILAIDTVDDKYKIYCKVGLFDNHLVRAPFDSELKVKKYQKGLNLNPNTVKAKALNEQATYKFTSEEDQTVLKLKLISGLCNIGIDEVENKNVSQGEELVYFLDGIAIITVKKENKLLVSFGEKLLCGQTILYKK